MNKKVIGMIGIFTLICIIGVSSFFLLNNKKSNKEEENNNTNTNETTNNNQENTNNNGTVNATINNRKVLVVYFSATNNTKGVAEKIAKNLNGDVFEIKPKDEYTSEDLNWTNENREYQENMMMRV